MNAVCAFSFSTLWMSSLPWQHTVYKLDILPFVSHTLYTYTYAHIQASHSRLDDPYIFCKVLRPWLSLYLYNLNVSSRLAKHLAKYIEILYIHYIYKEFSTYYVPSSALCSCFHNLVTILSSSSFSTTPLKVTRFMASNFFNCVTLNSFSSSKLSISAK